MRCSVSIPVALLLVVLATAPARAAEWSAQPQLTLGLDTNSNRRLALEAESSRSLSLAMSAALVHAEATQMISVAPRLTLWRFDGADSELGSNDAGLDFKLSRLNESWQFDVSVGAARDSTLTSELTDTGIIEDRTRRQTLDGSISLGRKFGARGLLQLQANYSDIEFARAENTGLVPYEYATASAAYQHQLNERTDFVLQLNAARLSVERTDTVSDSLGTRATLLHRFHERLRAELGVGFTRVESDDSSDGSAVLRASGIWTSELVQAQISIARDVQPSGRGRLVDADSVSVAIGRRMADRITVSASGTYVRREDLLFQLLREERDYRNVAIGAAWQVSPTLQLSAVVNSARQSYDLLQRSASGARFGLSVNWQPRRFAISR